MGKRTRFQQALIGLDACAPGRRFVGTSTLREFWARSLASDPDDACVYRGWLARALAREDVGYSVLREHFCGCGCDRLSASAPRPTMKQVLAAARKFRSRVNKCSG